MRRIQSCEVWRDKNSRQRKVYTKASRAVKSVSRTEKTMEGSEWAGEKHKGRWRDRQRPFTQGSLRIMIQSLESIYTHYIFVRWMKVFYFSWKKIIFVVKNAPFQFFFFFFLVPHPSILFWTWRNASCFLWQKACTRCSNKGWESSLLLFFLSPETARISDVLRTRSRYEEETWINERDWSFIQFKQEKTMSEKLWTTLKWVKKIIWCPNNLLGYLCLLLSLSYSTKINQQKNNSEHD